MTLKFSVTAPDLFNYLASYTVSTQQIGCILQVNGQLDMDLLDKAVRLTLQMEPVLGCRLVEDPLTPYWKRREDLNSLQVCTLLETQDVERAVQSVMTAETDRADAPMLQVTVLRSDRDTLCIKIFHACSDGGGLKSYLQLLASVYARLQAGVPVEIQPASPESRDHQAILSALGIDDWRSAIDMSSFLPPTWSFPFTPGEHADPCYSIRRLDQQATASLLSFAREQKVTANDMLLTAFTRALYAITGKDSSEPMVVSTTVDLRRFLPEEAPRSISNLSGMDYISVEQHPGERFVDLLSRISGVMAERKQKRPGIQTILAMEAIVSQGFETALQWMRQQADQAVASGLCTPGLTNIGLISSTPLYFGSLEVTDGYMLAPVQYAPNFALAASTYNGRLTLSIGYHRSTTEPAVIEDFLDRMTADLPITK
jgi:NRPS condensation-like uncharacterized protein